MRYFKYLFMTVILVSQVKAHDFAPAPDPKTMEWTIAKANIKYPKVVLDDMKVSEILKVLDNSLSRIGYYLDIDRSEVELRLWKKMTIISKETSWLSVLSTVADEIDADIEISPGKFKLVPRRKEKKQK